jgi:hypothetical protein
MRGTKSMTNISQNDLDILRLILESLEAKEKEEA